MFLFLLHWFSPAVILKSCYMIINSLWIEINFKMQREITPIWEDQFASVGGYFNSQSVTTFKVCRYRREKGGIFKLKFVYNVYLNGHWKSVWPLIVRMPKEKKWNLILNQRLKFKSLCFHHHICYLLINKVYYIPNLSLIRTSTRWLSLNVSIFVLIFPLENTLNLENVNVTILLLISTFIHLSHE